MKKITTLVRQVFSTSALRILPATLVGLLPFNLLDDAILSSQYNLRGQRAPSHSLLVVSTSNPGLAFSVYSTFAQKMKDINTIGRCISFFTNENHAPEGCKNYSIEGRHVLKSFQDLPQIALKALFPEDFAKSENLNSHKTVHFYGHLETFNPLRADAFLDSPIEWLNKKSREPWVLVLIPEKSNLSHFIATPAGDLDPIEIGVNIVGNAQENSFLVPINRFSQLLISLLASMLIAWILYSYPIFLTFLFTIILGSFLFVIAMIFFDRFGWQFPLVAPWTSMATVYLLGMSDRLDKRERSAWSLEQHAKNLQSLDELRNNFLSLVSHDLKTPIARIRSVLERFERGDFGPVSLDQAESLKKILSASGDLQRTISTLLILSRIESRDFRIQKEPTDLNELIERAITQIIPFSQDRKVQIETDLEPLFLVELDKGLITEVLVNIVENAIKYAPTDSVITIKSGESPICPELYPPREGIWFEVQDSGPGIPVEEREKVFQKFVKGTSDATTSSMQSNPVKGTGLGLYLASFFVEKHGGIISLISKVQGEIPEPGSSNDQYFSEKPEVSGTVIRVILPVDGPLDSSDEGSLV
jgi:signal transduction histidine kinase